MECIVGWPAAALTGAGAMLVGATVIGIPLAFRMLSAMPWAARLGRDAGGEPGEEPRWGWRC